MKKERLITAISIVCLFTLWNCSCTPANAMSAKEKTPAKESPAVISIDPNAPSEASIKNSEEQKQIKEAQEKAEQTKTEAETAKKEALIQEKVVELEKKKAEQKHKEAELAKKEVVAIKETAKSKTEVDEAVAKAQQMEKDALAAKEKVTLAEEKKLTTQKRVEITEEELKLAMERAAVAEAKITENLKTTYKKLLQTGLIVLIGYLLLFILVRVINRRVENLKARHLARRNAIYILNALIILYITFLWVQNIGAITIFISVTSAGLVLVLQDVILSIVGWFYILVHKPFEVGDRIEMGAVKGDVMDISLFQTSLLEIGNWVDADQSTGRIVNVPNSAVFKKETYNYSRGFEFIWNEIKILVTFESDWKRAEKVMLNYGTAQSEEMAEVVKRKIKKMTMHYMIYYEKLTPIVYVNIKDSGVELTLRYLTEARKRRTTQDALCRMILEDFEKEQNVSFAYPTYRIVK
ncbi:MAG: mechanosensitive ion channel [Phycisphaerae bacterium]|nr:mechanosensitive ion channel [Phycisphaerae bacterium]